MFVAKRIRARLLEEGRRQGASEELLRIAATVMVQHKRGHEHANHFRIRIYCNEEDRPQCRDVAPYWPWYRGSETQPSLHGIEGGEVIERITRQLP